jgi:hypothetical protein
MKRWRASLLAGVFVLLCGTVWASWPSRAASGTYGTAVVRLYSGGQVVGEWEAVGPGRMEGGMFVFPIRKGVRDFDVQIRGTFSFERNP